MSDILDEVQEELREQKGLNNLKQYAKFAGIALVAILVVTIGWGQYQESRKASIYAEGEKYNKALISFLSNRQSIETSVGEFEQIFENANSAYSILAGFQVAKISLAMKDADKASKTLHKIANAKNASDEYKEYASLLALVIDHDSNKIQTTEFVKKLERFATKETFVKGVTDEFLAAELINMNEFKQALEYINALKANETLAASASTRAYQLERVASAQR